MQKGEEWVEWKVGEQTCEVQSTEEFVTHTFLQGFIHSLCGLHIHKVWTKRKDPQTNGGKIFLMRDKTQFSQATKCEQKFSES